MIEQETHLFTLSANGGHYLLSRWGLKPENGHNDFDQWKNQSAGFLALVIGAEGAVQYVFFDSRKFVFNFDVVKRMPT